MRVLFASPEPHANARRGAARTTGALVGAGLRNLFDEQRVDAAIGIVTRNARQSAVNHEPHTVNRERSFRDVGGNDNLALAITRDGGVLILRRQFTVKWKENKTLRFRGVTDGVNRLRDLKATGHEHEHIAFAAGTDVIAERLGGLLPNGGR